MIGAAVSLLAGLLFGLGLVISRMIDPGKVLGFLDLAGEWDASLALVMAGALPVAATAFGLARGRKAPLLAARFHGPRHGEIDWPLLAGAAVFGTGWGLVGFCPGPALTALALGQVEPLVFVAAMLAGMAAQGLYRQRGEQGAARSSRAQPSAGRLGRQAKAAAAGTDCRLRRCSCEPERPARPPIVEKGI
jgi:uncharacterized membrane protein YedE/YeeE